MKLVLDNNILFSLMKPGSTASHIFSIKWLNFSAPEYIKSELEEHKPECLLKSKLSEDEFKTRLSEVEERIEFLNLSKYKRFLRKSIEVLSDPEDSPYVALALLLNTAIWSNDLHLKKQPLVKVYTTKELVEKLLKEV